MILKKIISALLLCILCSTCQPLFTMDDQQKQIVFDMNLLVQPDPTAALQKLGISGISQSLVSGSFNEESSLIELFNIISGINLETKSQDEETVIWKGLHVPSAMVSWLKGKASCETMLENTKSRIANTYYWTSRMNTLADMAFNPTSCTQVLSPCIETFNVIEQLQSAGHTVHALGNWHSDVRSSITSSLADSFSKIKGQILVSGDLGHVKCKEHSNVYTEFLHKLDHDNDHVLFIETESKHHFYANEQNTVVGNVANISLLAAQLRRKGLLPSKE